jgi:hypothetical protein
MTAATISYSSAGITSAAGVISLLDEPQIELKIFALNKLNLIVHEFWAEISDVVDKMSVHLISTFLIIVFDNYSIS